MCAACGIAENDASRVLKPYQLVGVNFMLLLHRKNVGGGISALLMTFLKHAQSWVVFLDFLYGFSRGFWRRRYCIVAVVVLGGGRGGEEGLKRDCVGRMIDWSV